MVIFRDTIHFFFLLLKIQAYMSLIEVLKAIEVLKNLSGNAVLVFENENRVCFRDSCPEYCSND
jgi:hypothetical protein